MIIKMEDFRKSEIIQKYVGGNKKYNLTLFHCVSNFDEEDVKYYSRKRANL